MTDSSRRAQQLGRIGALTSWARTEDRTARTKPGRQKFLKKFEDEVDPDGVLSPDERAKRGEFARRAYFQRMAVKSADVRSRRARSSPPTETTDFGLGGSTAPSRDDRDSAGGGDSA